jgi:hypothetical protein
MTLFVHRYLECTNRKSGSMDVTIPSYLLFAYRCPIIRVLYLLLDFLR